MILNLSKTVPSKNKFVGRHWRTKHRDTQEWEKELSDVCLRRPPKFKGKVRIIISSFRTRLLDTDNLWTVGLLDAMVRLGIIENDSEEFVELKKHQVKVNGSLTKTQIDIQEV